MDEIILIGAGGHTRSCIDVIELEGKFKIAGLVEKDSYNIGNHFGYPIIGTDQNLPDLRSKYKYALITVGQIKSSAIRVKLYKLLTELEFLMPVIVSPLSHVSKYTNIGDGTIIMHHAIINTNAKIGINCIINSKCLIEHDAVIGNHCHISTGAIVNGQVSIGNNSFVGSGVITKERISIGNNCIIGAGEVIKSSVKSNQTIA